MKKGLIFATTLAMALGVGVAVGAHQKEAAEVKATDPVVYLKPGVWAADNAKFVVHNWAQDVAADDILMTEVATDPGVYKCTISSTKNMVLFKRMNPSASIDSWASGELWNQSADLTFDSTKPCYEVTDWGVGAWSAYTEPAAASVYKYKIGDAAAVTMTKGTGTEYVSAELDFAKGDVVSFLKDDVAYAVTPKDSGKQTKVYSVTGGLKFAEEYHGVLYLETSTAELWAGQFTPGYYLVGAKGEWNAKLGLKASLESGENPQAYVVQNVELDAGDELKFVQFASANATIDYYSADASKVSTGSEVEYSVVSDGYDGHNLKVTNAGTYDIYYNPTSEYYSIEDVNWSPDIPAQEGYYLCGDFSGVAKWKYNVATKMDDATGQNVAHKMNVQLAANDELRVRSYFDAQDPKDRWATCSNVIDTEDPNRLFDMSGDNLKIRVAGYYDVYAYYDGSAFMFNVAEHVDTFAISFTGVKFEGKLNTEVTVPFANQLAYDGSVFNPNMNLLSVSGYVTRGVYTDAACSVDYVPHAFSAAGQLYVKLTKVAYYVAGDATFAGSAAAAWEVDGAVLLPPASNDTENNLLEGSVIIPASASEQNPILIRPFSYQADGTKDWISYSLGNGVDTTYPFCSKVGDNLSFTEGGTYAFYVNKSGQVWITKGLQAFLTKFLTETHDACVISDDTARVNALKAVWPGLESAFKSLGYTDEETPRDEKQILRDIGFDGGSDADDAHRVILRYHYIVWKYGSAEFADFIFEIVGGVQPHHNYNGGMFNVIGNNDNSLMIVIISIAATSALAFGAFLYLKKRKQK